MCYSAVEKYVFINVCIILVHTVYSTQFACPVSLVQADRWVWTARWWALVPMAPTAWWPTSASLITTATSSLIPLWLRWTESPTTAQPSVVSHPRTSAEVGNIVLFPSLPCYNIMFFSVCLEETSLSPFSFSLSFSVSLSLTHTHTHTLTYSLLPSPISLPLPLPLFSPRVQSSAEAGQ